jgi:hypothetical protein
VVPLYLVIVFPLVGVLEHSIPAHNSLIHTHSMNMDVRDLCCTPIVL